MMKRTISGMTGIGSLAHNRRDFIAENVNQNRVYLNICYRDENLKDIYKELFDESVERYNVGKRNDRKITNYYDKIQHGKQEKLFHEVIFQIGNNKDMAAGTPEGDLAVKVLDEYMQDFQRRNPTLRVFCCYLHQDEATPHLHIDFVPYVTGWKGKGMDTRVSLKQALKSLGFQGGAKHDTELNQWINHEKEVLAEIMERHEIEWEQKGTHEEHLDVYNFKKKERAKEVKELEQKIENLTADVEATESDIKALNQEKADAEKARDQVRETKVMENNINIVNSFCQPYNYAINPIVSRSTIRELSRNPEWEWYENYLHAARMNLLILGMEYDEALEFINKNDTLGTYERMKKSGYLRKRLIV